MNVFELDQTGKLTVNASLESSSADFDFLEGRWSIENRKLAERLSGSQKWDTFQATGSMKKHLLGMGNYDDFLATIDGQPFEGMSLRLFNRETRLWSIYWADSNRGTLEAPVVGSFAGSRGEFYGFATHAGRSILMKFNWDKSDADNPVWSQAYSPDNGNSWEWNWYMNFHR